MKYSIIIPVYDDPALRNAITALQQLDFPKTDYEVLIVENGKKTNWIEPLVVAAGYRYVYSETAGSYHARNLGMQQANGDIFAFSDSDCQVDSRWLRALTDTFATAAVVGVMGFTRGANSTSMIARYEQQMYEANIARFTSEAKLRRIDTRNFAIRRGVFQTLGGFLDDIRFGGDMEYGARAHTAGLTLVYNANCTAEHANIEDLAVLLAKRVTQNRANMALLTKHDRAFVQTYFPQLLRYHPGLRAQLAYCLYWLLYLVHKPISQWLCNALPARPGFFYFKALNVVAIRLGMLQAVLHPDI